MYANTGAGFVLIGSNHKAQSDNFPFVTDTVRDITNVNRTVIKGTVNDEVVVVLSWADFTIDSSDPDNAITGFDVIHQGFSPKNTTNAHPRCNFPLHTDTGVLLQTPDRLGGHAASEYVRSSGRTGRVFGEIVRFSDAGFTVGASNDLAVKIENDNLQLF